MSIFRKMLGTLQRLTAFRAIGRTLLPRGALLRGPLLSGLLPLDSRVRLELMPTRQRSRPERGALVLERRAQLQQPGALEGGL